MNNYQRFYYWYFIFACIVCFSPIKALPYIIPILFIILSQFSYNRIVRILIVIFSIGLMFAAYRILYFDTFVSQNFILSVITYSSFLPLLFVNYRQLYSENLQTKLIGIIKVVLIIQCVWGIAQALYGFSLTKSFDIANGDFVEGTIAPGLAAELSFSNVMFVTNLVFLLNFVLGPYLKANLKHKSIFFLTILVIILASVVHLILIYISALMVAFIVVRPKIFILSKGSVRKVLMIFSVFIGLSFFFLKDNISRIPQAVSNIASQEFPRAIVTYRVLTELPSQEPLQPFIGIGPGQFSSRASLINSGRYLGGPNSEKTLPFFEPAKNVIADDYVFSLMEKWEDVNYLGSSNQPYYSFLSIYSELGLIGLVAFLVFTVAIILKAVKVSRHANEISIDCYLLVSGVIFLFTLGIQENYFEVPQAIFLGILLLQFLYAKINYAKQ